MRAGELLLVTDKMLAAELRVAKNSELEVGAGLGALGSLSGNKALRKLKLRVKRYM